MILEGLNIRHFKSLCCMLGTSPCELRRLYSIAETQYIEHVVKKKNGGYREIAEPYERLKEISRKLNAMLQRVKLPKTIHGGRKGRSYITNAKKHQRKSVVLKLDIKDCFPSITNRMVYRVFERRLGCHPSVARYLTRLTTLHGCLPQGAPASSIITAFVLEPLAVKLGSLAKANGATFTQYIDDITFSGPPEIEKLKPIIIKTINKYGFDVKESKIEILRSGTEHIVTGVRVDQGLDAPRKAIRKTRSRIENLGKKLRGGHNVSEREIQSIEGLIASVAQFNGGAGKSLRKRLRKYILLNNPRVRPQAHIRAVE